jgi:hypothetical protein
MNIKFETCNWPKNFAVSVSQGDVKDWTCRFSASRQDIVEFFRLLRYCAAWGGLKPTFQDYLSVTSSRVKEHLDPWKMGPSGSLETSVSKHLTSRNNPEYGRIRFNRDGNPRSRTETRDLSRKHTISHGNVRSRTETHDLSRKHTISHGNVRSRTETYDLARKHFSVFFPDCRLNLRVLHVVTTAGKTSLSWRHDVT